MARKSSTTQSRASSNKRGKNLKNIAPSRAPLEAISSLSDGRRSYMRKINNLNFKPVLGLIAGGVGVFALYKVGRILYSKYPQIGSFLRDNLDTIESRIGEFRESFRGREEGVDLEARH